MERINTVTIDPRIPGRFFHPEERQYYRLERLWDEGTNRLELPFIHDDEEEPRPFLP